MNDQAIEKTLFRADGSLDVVSVWSTLQGEGPWAGMPAVFVRLAGCNLQCPLCDTDYTTLRSLKTPAALVQQVELSDRSASHQLVVLTGGEPFRQNITPFIRALLDRREDRMVQIETNGTLYPPKLYLPSDERVTVVCSPKSPALHPEVVSRTCAFKYVVDHGSISEEDGLPLTTLGNEFGVARPPDSLERNKIYIQPCDEGTLEANEKNTQAALAVCTKFGYRFCLQVHKILGLE